MVHVTRFQIASKSIDVALFDRMRFRELSRLARRRYTDGNGDYVLPETADGKTMALALITHQPLRSRQGWLFDFCSERAPWLDPDEIEPDRPRRLSAETLGRLLHVTAAERDAERIRTIAPCDQTRAQRRALRKAKRRLRERERQRAKRALAKKQSRAAYLATHTLSQLRPWEADGISRASWYRQRRETSQLANNLSSKELYCGPTHLSHGASDAAETRSSPARGGAAIKDDLIRLVMMAAPRPRSGRPIARPAPRDVGFGAD